MAVGLPLGTDGSDMGQFLPVPTRESGGSPRHASFCHDVSVSVRCARPVIGRLLLATVCLALVRLLPACVWPALWCRSDRRWPGDGEPHRRCSGLCLMLCESGDARSGLRPGSDIPRFDRTGIGLSRPDRIDATSFPDPDGHGHACTDAQPAVSNRKKIEGNGLSPGNLPRIQADCGADAAAFRAAFSSAELPRK